MYDPIKSFYLPTKHPLYYCGEIHITHIMSYIQLKSLYCEKAVSHLFDLAIYKM